MQLASLRNLFLVNNDFNYLLRDLASTFLIKGSYFLDIGFEHVKVALLLSNHLCFLNLKVDLFVFNYLQTGALVDELNRVSAENKKLTEMLTVMCENYNALRNQLMDYMSKNGEKEQLAPLKKRKSESSNNNDNNIAMNGISESSSTDEESCKKPREEVIKAKISRVYVRTEASDTGLVSAKFTPLVHNYKWFKFNLLSFAKPCLYTTIFMGY